MAKSKHYFSPDDYHGVINDMFTLLDEGYIKAPRAESMIRAQVLFSLMSRTEARTVVKGLGEAERVLRMDRSHKGKRMWKAVAASMAVFETLLDSEAMTEREIDDVEEEG